MITLSAGSGGGVKGRVSFINTGIFMGISEEGLWSGNVLNYRSETVDINSPFINLDVLDPSTFDGYYNYQQVETFHEESYEQCDPRGKNFVAQGRLPVYSVTKDSIEYYTQCEVAAGLFYYIRVGFNPGEILDFILGWTTLDIYRDDKSEINDSNQGVDPTL